MKITISSFTAGDLLSQIADQLSIPIEEDCQRQGISLPTRLGDGDFITYQVSDPIL